MKKLFLLSLMAILLPLATWAQTFKVEVADVEYAGTDTQSKVEVKVTTEKGVAVDTDNYAVTYSKEVKDVGEYTVRVRGIKGEYLDYTDATATFKVTPKEVGVVTLKEVTKEYGTADEDVDLSEFVTVEEGVLATGDTEADLVKSLQLVRFNASYEGLENVGDVIKVYVASKTDGTANYTYTFTEKADIVNLTIKAKTLTGTLTPATSVYNGKEVELTSLKYELKGIIGEDDVTALLTKQANAIIKDVNEYTLTVALSGDDAKNYTIGDNGTTTATYTITRAKLNIVANDDLGKIYDGDDAAGTDVTEMFTITGVNGETAEYLNLKMIVDDQHGEVVNVGKYLVNPVVNGTTIWKGTDDKGYKEPALLPNYDISGYDRDNLKYEISKAEVTYYFASKGKVYDAEAVTTLTEGEKGDYQLVYDGFVGDDDFAENGKPVADFDKESVEEVKNVGEYELVNTTEEIKSDGTVENYTFRLLEADDVEDLEEGVSVNVYEITQAEATIAVRQQEIAFGLSEEELAEEMKDWFDYLHTDITIDNATDRGTLRYMYTLALGPGAQTGKSGKYEGEDGIVITLKDEEDMTDAEKLIVKNYDITLKHGTLVIGGKEELELDGSEEDLTELLEENNGAKVDKVTIKNLMNVTLTNKKIVSENWYTLVLPFDVTPYDLTVAFGNYPIVNIPDESRSDGNAYFKLTMQTVPANTLMAFKVAEDMDWDEIEGVTFENKTIVAPTGEWATDGAGNQFKGTYTIYETESALDKILFTDGKFYKASVLATARTPIVYPLNGYVTTATAEARIFVEDADGTVTAITAINADNKANAAEGWYTVGGVKLNAEPTEKGVYINNGKKVVIK